MAFGNFQAKLRRVTFRVRSFFALNMFALSCPTSKNLLSIQLEFIDRFTCGTCTNNVYSVKDTVAIKPPRESRVRLKWDDRLEQLKAFKTIHGHVDVPRSYAKEPSLGTFVCNQRQTYKRMNEGKGLSMDRSRVLQLNELGFKWRLKHKDQPGLVDTDDEVGCDPLPWRPDCDDPLYLGGQMAMPNRPPPR